MPFLNWPYVEGKSGWGSNTGSYKFCEMDYYLTPYIAEFISTITNLGYISLGIRGIQNNGRNANDQVVNICYSTLIFVGVGSALYHMNLKYFTQMIDEASMLYATAAIMYGAMSITLGRTTRNSLATLVTGIIIAVSIAHFYINDVKTFRRTFLAMLLSVLFQCIWLLSARVPDAKVKRAAQYLALYGTGTFAFGFILWNIDNKFCGRLTQARDVVGMPLGFLTELHGWWHIWTGIGVYHYIVFIEYLRSYIKAVGEKTKPATLIWRNSFSLPYLVQSKK